MYFACCCLATSYKSFGSPSSARNITSHKLRHYVLLLVCILIVVYVFLLFVHVFLSLSMYSYLCLCIHIFRPYILMVVYVFLFRLCILIVRPCILIIVYVFLLLSTFLDKATLTEVFPCFFLGCKANARV
jgi:hypothetical protein